MSFTKEFPAPSLAITATLKQAWTSIAGQLVMLEKHDDPWQPVSPATLTEMRALDVTVLEAVLLALILTQKTGMTLKTTCPMQATAEHAASVIKNEFTLNTIVLTNFTRRYVNA